MKLIANWRRFYYKPSRVFGIFFVLVVIIYGQTLFGNFVLDDRGILEHASSISNPFEIKNIFSMPYWTTEAGLYRPVVIYSYALNYAFLGSGAFGFHFINLLLYIFVCFFLFDLLRRTLRNNALAFLSSLIFLVLPIHTEVVANIIGRAEILALMFSLLLLLECIKKKVEPWKVGLWMFLAIGSKETAIAVIPMAMLLVYFLKIEGRNALVDKYWKPAIASLSAIVIYFSLRLLVLGPQLFIGVKTSIVENSLSFTDAQTRIFTALNVLTMYISKSIMPSQLCSDYSYNQLPLIKDISNAGSLIGLSIFLLSFVGIFYFIKKQKALSLGCAFFFFSFLPVSNILFPIGTIAGERLMFYPSVGIAIFGAFIFLSIFKFLKNKPGFTNAIVATALLSILVIYAFISIKRADDWQTEKKLFISAALCAPNSVLSRSNMGTVYYFNGEYDKAEEELLASLQIYDGYSRGLNNLGLVYWKKGDNSKAREFYIKALTAKFPYPGAYENIVLLYLSEGNVEDAERWLRIIYDGNKGMINAYIRQYTGSILNSL